MAIGSQLRVPDPFVCRNSPAEPVPGTPDDAPISALEIKFPVAVTPPCQELPLYTRNSLAVVLNTKSPVFKLEVGSEDAILYWSAKLLTLAILVATVLTFYIDPATVVILLFAPATVLILVLLPATVLTLAIEPATVLTLLIEPATVVTSVAFGVTLWNV